jgi:NitT/TauT family transport system permease protein
MPEVEVLVELKPPASPRLRSALEITRGFGLPFLAFLLLVVAWQLVVVGFKVPEYIVPAPSKFIARFFTARNLLWSESLVTGTEVLEGFAIATVISIPLALLIVSVRLVEQALYPLIVFLQLIPKIAVAPLFIVWFGFGQFPKVLLTFLLCFFPILVDSMTGFKAIDQRLLYLTRSMGAKAWQTVRFVRLPAAMPFIFSGLKVGIVLAVTGAIVGEFVGSNAGLGFLLLRGSSYLDTVLIFAVLVALSAMGLLFSYAVEVAERLVIPWQHKEE